MASSDDPIASKASMILDLPPSCIQFCQQHPQYFVVGTYNLQKDEPAQSDSPTGEEGPDTTKKAQSRHGSLVVFKTNGKDVTQIQTTLQPSALLDLRFHPDPKHQDILAVVSSTGTVAIFKLDPVANPELPLQHLATSRCDDVGEDVLFLQCNWLPSDPTVIGVTTSSGGLAKLLKLDDQWRISSSADLDIENSLEAWCIAFAPTDDEQKNVITAYCGGDDSILRYNTYDSTINDDDDDDGGFSVQSSFSPLAIKGQHNAGVTAILPLHFHDALGGRLVVTGSYDDHISLMSIQDPNKSYGMKRVQVLAEENLGGGVWRLELIDVDVESPRERVRLLVSCMHVGSRIVEFVRSESSQKWECRVLARFEEHKSMNYGSALVPMAGNGGEGKLRVVSTSFYDKLLCLWEYNES